MLSLIVGCIIGFRASRAKVGLALVLLYGVVVGVISADVTYHDGAGLMPAILALVGFGLARLVIGVRHLRRVWLGSGQAELPKGSALPGPKSEHPYAPPSDTGGDGEELYVTAGIAHAVFLNTCGRELDDVEFAASAFGAFDGIVQALGRELSPIDMLAKGSTFVLLRIRDLQRMQDASPSEKGDAVGLAMVSPIYDGLRARAGQHAYILRRNMPLMGGTVY